MSSNKLKYFTVNSTSIVAANNKADAQAIARGRRGVTGRIIDNDVTVDRISAAEAHASSKESLKTMTA